MSAKILCSPNARLTDDVEKFHAAAMTTFLDVDEPTCEIVKSMTLAKLLQGVSVSKMFHTLYGQMVVTHDIQVGHVQYDSRRIEHGDLFVALRGTGTDGHSFIVDAISKGAKAVVVENDNALPDSYFMHVGAAKIVVQNSRIALAQISSNFYQNPARHMTMIGVTGTNGKTTTTHLIRSILEHRGDTTGLIGTIAYAVGDEMIHATHTTPESLELQALLSRMVERHCTSAVMEVSSHALHQHRTDGIPFTIGVFTNLTQDHLDYHTTMDQYFNAKKLLFEALPPQSTAIINADDEWGMKLFPVTKARTLSYGLRAPADLCASGISLTMKGTSFTITYNGKDMPITSSLIGRFNVHNILAAFAAGIALEIPVPVLQEALKTISIRGRFEQIAAPQGWTAVIDYAHTPDALQKTLMAVRDISGDSFRGRMITVFGCGGNRDRQKRPIMASIATTMSDITIITSDNPRHEEPLAIIDEVIAGAAPGANVVIESNRAEAITRALSLAVKNDVIIIAGKGHEEYQVVGDQKFHFSDHEVVDEFIRSHP